MDTGLSPRFSNAGVKELTIFEILEVSIEVTIASKLLLALTFASSMTSSLEDLGLYSIRVQSVVWFHWQNEKDKETNTGH